MLAHFFHCPHCSAEITLELDPTVIAQRYVEDCNVCSNPVDIYYDINENKVCEFHVKSHHVNHEK